MNDEALIPKSIAGMTLRGCDDLVERLVEQGVLTPMQPTQSEAKEVSVQPMFRHLMPPPIIHFDFSKINTSGCDAAKVNK